MTGIFSGRMLIGWLAAALLTFAASLFFMGRGDDSKSGADTVGPSAFSRSAIGHAGFAETLHALGLTVVKSQYDSRAKLSEGGLLVIAEPGGKLGEQDRVGDLLDAKTVLLVLPKWHGLPSDKHAGWIGYAELAPLSAADQVLNLAVAKAEVARVAMAPTWSKNVLGHEPTLVSPVQVIRGGGLTPIVASDDDVLVGELTEAGRRLWILADPDVIENHGISVGDNAAFAAALVKALRSGSGSVVFDETVHGYVARPDNPLRLMFQFPFVVVTLQGLMAIALLLWATLGRFGAPETAPPALSSGKQGLVESAAKLLGFAGYQPRMVRRYVQASLRDVARQLHAPRGLSERALLDWLQRVGQARGADVDCAELYRETEGITDSRRGSMATLIPIARGIHRWKREILDGPAADSRDYRGRADRGAEGRRRAG
ncbi:MAG TPA: DUF4350 domain-containing protein [Stellaceae bacterium]|nr:DUF4350 domain-containing protein [Stellaceae bacterium]